MDKLLETKIAMINFILDHAPSGLQDRVYLARRMNEPGQIEHCHHLDFRRLSPSDGKSGHSAYVECGIYNVDTFDDAEGNLVSVHEFRAQVNWPSHGSMPINLAEERLQLYTELTNFCRKLLVAFDYKITVVVKTRAERIEQEAENVRRRAYNDECKKLDSLLTTTVKGLRAGSTRLFDAPNISDGTYTITKSNKSYNVLVRSNTGHVTRNS